MGPSAAVASDVDTHDQRSAIAGGPSCWCCRASMDPILTFPARGRHSRGPRATKQAALSPASAA